MNFTNNMTEAREEQFRALRKLEKININIPYLPDHLRNFILCKDGSLFPLYSIDEEGNIFDPDSKEYPDIDTIQEEYEYCVTNGRYKED